MAGFQRAWQVARISTSSPVETLALGRLSGKESLSTLFTYRMECVSEDAALDLYSVLGQNISVELDVHGGNKRYINGVVASATNSGSRGEYTSYTLEVKPWLWLLTHTTDCRIYTDRSAPDIVMQLLQDNGFVDVDNRLADNYPLRHYCVQYQESDFSFISRLMEHEGIYYYFEHKDNQSTLVLCDDASAHETFSGYENVSHGAPVPADESEQETPDFLSEWFMRRQVNSTKYVMNDYGYADPKADLLVSAAHRVSTAWTEYEQYEYPGAYPRLESGQPDRTHAERLAQRRLEREMSLHEISSGHGNVRGLSTGHLFSLTGCEREDQNREYLIISAELDIRLDSYFSGANDAAIEFNTQIECIPSQHNFRPQNLTVKPLIQGPQTALVVGPAGEQVWTDEHGRIKLQFHWDRYGKADENSSGWVRVSQLWAGERWGAIYIPRIGQEVIVEFIDGDPDRPIVTGRVYNGDQPAPYDLPASALQSGIKSKSGSAESSSNFNEIRMDDESGHEEFYIQAEKNYRQLVKNDHSEAIGNDYSVSVVNNKSETVGHDKNASIANSKTTNVGLNHREAVGRNMMISVGANLTEMVGINYAQTVGAVMNLSIGAAFVETVGNTKKQSIAQSKTESIGNDKKVDIGGNKSDTIGGEHIESVGKNYKLNAKTVLITAEDKIVLNTGKASITLESDGTIIIDGKDVTVNEMGKFDITGDKDAAAKTMLKD